MQARIDGQRTDKLRLQFSRPDQQRSLAEFSGSNAGHEATPLLRCEPQNRTIWVLAIPHTDVTGREPGDLDACAVRVTPRADLPGSAGVFLVSVPGGDAAKGEPSAHSCQPSHMISLAATGYAKPPDQIVRNFASRFSTFGPLVSSPLRVGSHNDQSTTSIRQHGE
jgi:hypothetical protein